MTNPDPIVIESGGRSGRGISTLLEGRRMVIAGVLALAEVAYVVFGDPGAFLASIAATLVLIGAVMLAFRVDKGMLRDALWVIALAQVFTIAILSLKVIVTTIVIAVAVVAIIGGVLYFMGRSRLRKLGIRR